jgi:hypothetical protein
MEYQELPRTGMGQARILKRIRKRFPWFEPCGPTALQRAIKRGALVTAAGLRLEIVKRPKGFDVLFRHWVDPTDTLATFAAIQASHLDACF